MLSDDHRRVLELMAGSGLTPCRADRLKAALIIRAAESYGDRAFGMELVRARRATWLTYLTLTQRKWQRQTRRPSRARHHDSVAIREKYVRCA